MMYCGNQQGLIHSLYVVSLLVGYCALTGCDHGKRNPGVEPTIRVAKFAPITSGPTYSERCVQLQIDDLEKVNIDSQVRIWIQLGLSDTGRIFLIKKTNGHWQSQFHRYRFKYDKSGASTLTQQTENGMPKGGWESLFDYMEDQKFWEISGPEREADCNDGGGVMIELAGNGLYKQSIFECWSYIKGQASVKKLQAILNKLQDEFGYRIEADKIW